eukprot:g4445.t1
MNWICGDREVSYKRERVAGNSEFGSRVPSRATSSYSQKKKPLSERYTKYGANLCGGRSLYPQGAVPSQTIPGSLTTACVRVYRFRAADGRIHSLEVKHDQLFGSRIIELDGNRVHSSVGDADFDLHFTVCGTPGNLTITSTYHDLAIFFTYKCSYGGISVPSILEGVDYDGTLEGYAFGIPSFKIGDPETPPASPTEVPEVIYKIVVTKSDSKHAHSCYRSFTDFSDLHFDLDSFFAWQPELKAKLPSLPPSGLDTLFDDPFDPEFLERRRQGLEKFLLHLRVIPRLGGNADVLKFLGLTDREEAEREESSTYAAERYDDTDVECNDKYNGKNENVNQWNQSARLAARRARRRRMNSRKCAVNALTTRKNENLQFPAKSERNFPIAMPGHGRRKTREEMKQEKKSKDFVEKGVDEAKGIDLKRIVDV